MREGVWRSFRETWNSAGHKRLPNRRLRDRFSFTNLVAAVKSEPACETSKPSDHVIPLPLVALPLLPARAVRAKVVGQQCVAVADRVERARQHLRLLREDASRPQSRLDAGRPQRLR